MFITGELKDIGWGQKLFIRCSGTGEPVVLLDAPTGETSDIWTHVESSLNKYTKVIIIITIIQLLLLRYIYIYHYYKYYLYLLRTDNLLLYLYLIDIKARRFIFGLAMFNYS